MKSKRAIVFMSWGKSFVELKRCLDESRNQLSPYDLILITDYHSDLLDVEEEIDHVVRVNFKREGLMRKTELHQYIPLGWDSYCLLDCDTIVLGDISLGFEMAERHGIAIAPTEHYCLDEFWGFDKILAREGLGRRGWMHYNTGVVFISKPLADIILEEWDKLGDKYKDEWTNDQPFFTMAMIKHEFLPFVLTVGYNFRGFGEGASGEVRIWHNYGILPAGINEGFLGWPLRRIWPKRISRGGGTSLYARVGRRFGWL